MPNPPDVESFPKSVDPARVSEDVDADELQKDLDLYQSLESIRLVLELLLRQVENTQQAVGTDAMDASLEVYASLKRSSKDNRAKTYLEPMQARSSRATSSSSSV